MNKNSGISFFVVSICLICSFFVACDDELETDDIAPFFNLIFINQTAIDSLSPLVEGFESELTSINDSLSVLDSLTNAGDTRDFTANIAALTASRTSITGQLTDSQSLLTDAENGNLLINSVATLTGSGTRVFEDSLTEYTLPLNASANSSLYRISIGNAVYSLETEYERNTLVQERSVIIEALNFNIIEEGTSFNDFTLVCGDTVNCTSNEATVTLFF